MPRVTNVSLAFRGTQRGQQRVGKFLIISNVGVRMDRGHHGRWVSSLDNRRTQRKRSSRTPTRR